MLLDIPMEESPSFAESLRPRIEAKYPPLKFGQYHVKQAVLEHGTISFLLNGKGFGTAFENIYQGKYYPAVSIYGGAIVTINPGPVFAFPPQVPDVQPVCALSSL